MQNHNSNASQLHDHITKMSTPELGSWILSDTATALRRNSRCLVLHCRYVLANGMEFSVLRERNGVFGIERTGITLISTRGYGAGIFPASSPLPSRLYITHRRQLLYGKLARVTSNLTTGNGIM
jgi:hypothetical protein